MNGKNGEKRQLIETIGESMALRQAHPLEKERRRSIIDHFNLATRHQFQQRFSILHQSLTEAPPKFIQSFDYSGEGILSSPTRAETRIESRIKSRITILRSALFDLYKQQIDSGCGRFLPASFDVRAHQADQRQLSDLVI